MQHHKYYLDYLHNNMKLKSQILMQDTDREEADDFFKRLACT